MNDRFRFRAWHKPSKKMFEVHCFVDKEVFENTIDGVGASPTNPANIDDCVLMQCTGLKDKRGRLIYEGDIIELYRGKSNIHQKKGKRFEVKFLTHRFCGFGFGYVDCPSVDMTLTESKSKICKVIGNIHENPELLEDK